MLDSVQASHAKRKACPMHELIAVPSEGFPRWKCRHCSWEPRAGEKFAYDQGLQHARAGVEERVLEARLDQEQRNRWRAWRDFRDGRVPTTRESDFCNKGVECGGLCYLKPFHAGPCLCVSDDPGKPGSCPA